MSTGYPVRGWLHSLTEGSATLDEAETAINGFIEQARDRAWREGLRTTTLHGPHKHAQRSEKDYQSLCDMEPV